jgi:bacillolysin
MRVSSRVIHALALLTMSGLLLLGAGFKTVAPRTAQAQTVLEAPLAAVERLKQATGGKLSAQFAWATGVARFVRATDGATIPLANVPVTLQEKAYAFFQQYGAAFGVTAPRQQLVVTKVMRDDAGSDVRMAQRHNGLPVFNAELIVHFTPAGAITAVNGTFLPNLKVPTQAKISAGDATARATGAVAGKLKVAGGILQASAPVLGVTQKNLPQDEPGAQALVWKTIVGGRVDIREFVYVNASNGEIVESFTGVPDALQRGTYNMLEQDNYDLAIKCRGENDPPSADPDCNNAHTYAGDTYNFYWNGFRRDSYDDAGAPLKSYVHYASAVCPNAFWNGAVMTYCTAFPHDDVAAHEMTHAVTEHSANLVYAYQPGALNESFSDIFGESIDLLNSSENEANSRWKIGEGIAPVGLRDMANPENVAYMNPEDCSSDLYFCGSDDNGGVHYNSGVPNKAFVLMVDGGALNGVTVGKVGLNKSVAVQYRALTHYLSVYSNFVDDYEALQGACADLVGKALRSPDPETGGYTLEQTISKADCANVKAALDAVQMTYRVCSGMGPDAAGPLCASGYSSQRLFFTSHEGASNGWAVSSDTTLYSEVNWKKQTNFAYSGSYAWRINDKLTSCSGADYTSDLYLTSPAVDLTGSSKPILRFMHDFLTEGSYDGGTVEVEVNGSWVKLEKADFTLNGYNGEMDPQSTAKNGPPSSPEVFTGYRRPGAFPKLKYAESRVDLTTYLAQDTDKVVKFRFRFSTDNCNGTDIGWYLDDIEVYECKMPES